MVNEFTLSINYPEGTKLEVIDRSPIVVKFIGKLPNGRKFKGWVKGHLIFDTITGNTRKFKTSS